MSADPRLVDALARVIGEALANERINRGAQGRDPLGTSDEREYARDRTTRQLDAYATQQLSRGHTPLSVPEETDIVAAVLAKVLGLGRIQPLLDDPQINDIHIRGNAPVWVKLTNGERKQMLPVVETDDELIELVRMAATRMGRTERRFDAGNPELNLQLADGSRLFATMEVSSHPSVVIRKHRFELSSIARTGRPGVDR